MSAEKYRIIAQRLAMTTKRPSGTAWLNAYRIDVRFLLDEIERLEAAQPSAEDGEGKRS